MRRRAHHLQQMIQQGRNADSYLRLINSGIDNSRSILQTLPIKDEKVLAELRDFSFALRKIQGLYGLVPHSPEQDIQTLHDQTVAESLKMTNQSKDYSDAQERNSNDLAADARIASPKGAARMQVETSAQILRSLVQLLRINTQILKIQSEQLAINNKGSKESVSNYQKVSRDLGSGFSNFKPEMNLERF